MYDLGQYIPRQSLVHKLDPRVKIIAVIALSIIILQADQLGLLLAGISTLLLGLVVLAQLPPKYVLQALKPALPFFLCLFLVYLLFTPGRTLLLFPLGPLLISYEGLMLGIVQIWKFLLLLVAAALLTMTTTASELTGGLQRLLRPVKIFGISSHDIAMMLGLALRFIPTLQNEMRNVRDAQLARGAKFNPGRPGGKVKALGFLAVPLLLNIIRRSDELVDAMEARGYQPGRRSYLYNPALTRTDYVIITLIIILTMLAVFLPAG
ncbi:MAG: energy-coupling factor transporter transmembrane protein EcfT [Syntrophomonadaceae bacterium]|nr:energy-coupling factor transporter transmembrane protein EcfT [Syntrophomonadaceae bacterium]